MVPPKLIPQFQPQLCSRLPASALISHTPCTIYSGSHRSPPPNFPPPSSWLYPRPQIQQAFPENPQASPAQEAGRLVSGLHFYLSSSLSPSHGQLCSKGPAAAFPTLPLCPTSRGSHRSFPPSPPHCFTPAPNPSRPFLGTHRTPAREGGLTADLHLPLHFSKSSPQSHPQFCSRPSAMASPHSLYPSSGD